MSEKKNQEKQIPQNNVVSLQSMKCKAEGCKKKPERADFCSEHYLWFKEGLITAEGYHAKDFDKKYQIFLKHQSQKKAA